MNRILKPAGYFLAAVYSLADAVFLTVAKPLADWLAKHWVLERLRNWIVSLRPYPSLLLFAIPVVVLEPVKPVSLYLAGTGHVAMGAAVFVVGEILKLVLIERLFSLTCPKLITIPVFAWSYGKYRQAKDWMISSEAWQTMRRWSRIARYAIRSYLFELKLHVTSARLSS